MSVNIPLDLIVIFGPNFLVFICLMIFCSGQKTGGGSWFPATSERDDVGCIFHPIALFVGILSWGIAVKMGWL